MIKEKNSEFGRSMIEMLGVLAIVGILSIGGISAFQKAMRKHQINQMAAEFSQFINELLRYSQDLKRMNTNNETSEQAKIASSIEFFLPSTWRRQYELLYDSMNNRIYPFIRNDRTGVKNKYLSLDYHMRRDKGNTELCFSLYDIAKQYASMIYSVSVYTIGEEGAASSTRVWGSDYCNSYRNCLTDITFAEMKSNCDTCDNTKEGCSFVLIFKL